MKVKRLLLLIIALALSLASIGHTTPALAGGKAGLSAGQDHALAGGKAGIISQANDQLAGGKLGLSGGSSN